MTITKIKLSKNNYKYSEIQKKIEIQKGLLYSNIIYI